MKTTTKIMTVLLSAALAGGCAKQRTYQDAKMDFGSIERIAVLPFTNLTREPAAADRVRDVLATALLATNTVYVVPPGDVTRAIGRSGIALASGFTTDDVVKLGGQLKAQAVITGTVKEYGEMRSGSASANFIAVSIQFVETATGKVVWSGSTSKGGLTVTDRLLGATGGAMNDVTEQAVDDLIERLFK